jgi:hypothetical protein
MPDYSKGKIYTIRNRNDDTKIYVGSTIQSLSVRFSGHKRSSKTEKCINYKIYVEINNDWDNWYIELYENYPCNNKEELCKREGEIIRQIGTINSIIAGRDINQYLIDNAKKIKEQQKQYRIDNADKIKEQIKQYSIENADELKEKKKQYYIENADKIKQYQKHYCAKNADKIKEYKRQHYLKKKLI